MLHSTLFNEATWPLGPHADQFAGWDLAEVLRTPCGNATNNLTGKLYVHIRALIWSSHRYFLQKGVSFQVFNLDATDLGAVLPKYSFARIEVSD